MSYILSCTSDKTIFLGQLLVSMCALITSFAFYTGHALLLLRLNDWKSCSRWIFCAEFLVSWILNNVVNWFSCKCQNQQYMVNWALLYVSTVLYLLELKRLKTWVLRKLYESVVQEIILFLLVILLILAQMETRCKLNLGHLIYLICSICYNARSVFIFINTSKLALGAHRSCCCCEKWSIVIYETRC